MSPNKSGASAGIPWRIISSSQLSGGFDFTKHADQFRRVEPGRVAVATVSKTLGKRTTSNSLRSAGREIALRKDNVHILKGDRMPGLVFRQQNLVKLLSWPNANKIDSTAGRKCTHQIHDAHARNPRHEHFTAVHALEAGDDEVDSLIEREPEPSHPPIGDCHPALSPRPQQHPHHTSRT